MSINFQALVLQQEDRQTLAELRELSFDDLPEKEMLVRVHYSTLNYKDALAVTGKGRVIRKFPIIPGIDLAGEVIDPGNSAFKAGDHVISTGWGMGEEYWGGLGQYARLDPSWPLLLPAGLDMRSAMVMGTGGFTAALCVRAIMDHGTRPEDGPVLVTGAGGGVVCLVSAPKKTAQADALQRLIAPILNGELVGKDTMLAGWVVHNVGTGNITVWFESLQFVCTREWE